MDATSCRKPKIDYPCVWQYRLIGSDEEALRAALAACVSPERCALSPGRRSSGGRYLSLVVELTVADEAERLTLYQRLAEHPDIKMVL